MDKNTRTNFDNLHSEDGDTRFKAMNPILKMTEERVDWAHEVWDDLLKHLRHENNHQRAIAAQVLCNLAKSDTENRMVKDFAALLAVTKDEKFVTARHCLQSLWKAPSGHASQSCLQHRTTNRETVSPLRRECG